MGDLSREPSMEEILSSIRRVIARDDAHINGHVPGAVIAPVASVAPPETATAAEDFADDDVLDLTAASEADADVAVDDPAVDAPISFDTLPAPAIESDPVPPESATRQSPPTTADDADPLVSAAPQAAARQTLDTLAAALAAGRAADVRPVDSATTVNALVEAALRPMLRDWLDANLPGVVDRMVQREIARITGQNG